MRFRRIIAVCFCAFVARAQAQHSMAMDHNINKDYQTMRGGGDVIRSWDAPNFSFGCVYRYQWKNKLSINTGFAFKHFKQAVSFPKFFARGSSTGDQVFQVPFVVGYALSLDKQKIFI